MAYRRKRIVLKKHTGKSSQIALVNEYKGNLFEFMVAHELSKLLGCEEVFLKKMTPNFLQLLRNYQQYLLTHDITLSHYLKHEAPVVAADILKQYPHGWSEVLVIGKMAASDQEMMGEIDILLKSESQKQGISLKLTKQGSYMSTKSAGARSFLVKYFPCAASQKLQDEFNHIQDIEFSKLSRELESFYDLVPSDDFKSWRVHELSELPGSLTGRAHELLMEYYQKLKNKMTSSITELSRSEAALFHRGISTLMGFAHPEVTQVAVSYQRDVAGEFTQSQVHFHHFQEVIEPPVIEPLEGSATSLHIIMNNTTLQMRIKPMNVFTTKAIKINCSVRY